MRALPIFIAVVAFLTGCSTAGVKDIEYIEFDKTVTVEKDFNEVWGYVLEWSAINGFPIASTDKNDGIIMLTGSGTVSRTFLLQGGGADIDQQLVSCGEATGNIGLYKGRFTDLIVNATVILRDVEAGTRVTVNMSGNVGVEVRNGYGVVSDSRSTCASRGVFEERLFADLRSI